MSRLCDIVDLFGEFLSSKSQQSIVVNMDDARIIFKYLELALWRTSCADLDGECDYE